MGYIIDTEDEVLGLERRRESYNVLDLKRTYQDGESHSEHIFAYANGEIEMSARFLYKLIEYFNNNPKEMLELKRMALEF